MTSENKRKFKRSLSRYALKCRRWPLIADDEGIYVICNDVGAGGIMFTSVVAFKIGERLYLSLKLPGWDKFSGQTRNSETDTYSTPAKVVRITDAGDNVYRIAARFLRTTSAGQNKLLKYIEKNG